MKQCRAWHRLMSVCDSFGMEVARLLSAHLHFTASFLFDWFACMCCLLRRRKLEF